LAAATIAALTLTLLALVTAPLSALASSADGPVTFGVNVSGLTVTANLFRNSANPLDPVAAEYFEDAIGADGSGTAMTIGPSGIRDVPFAARGTLPSGLSLGTHTVYVHARDSRGANPTVQGVWGLPDSATFTLTSTTVTTQLGAVTVRVTQLGAYVATLTPGDPCFVVTLAPSPPPILPGDPCFMIGFGFALPSLAPFGFTRTSLPVAAGTINVDTIIIPSPPPILPTPPPIIPGGPPIRVAVVSIAATNGVFYQATTSGLTVTFAPGGPPI
jgi:hypothetical protein